MHIVNLRPVAGGIALALATLLAAACGPTAAPSASVAVTPSAAASDTAEATSTEAVTPSPEPTPSETPDETDEASASPTASEDDVDPTADLTIAEPYALEPLDDVSAAAFQTGIAESLGAMGEVIDFGAMTVTRDDAQVAILLAMAFPEFPGMEDPSFFESVMGGVAGSSGGEVETTTIAGRTVGLVEGAGTAFAGYQQDATVIFAIGQDMDEVTEVITALIEANG